ncbi:peptide/nickel transport system ATP-binding protein [Hathewaya proteolytica DSM 3090]|uniref:Peptide/nickel transport system ATP-binding protein n=1 Tax=Hathewaya proteolytica DSM 3090 TaxID=1121331 RepID=A0A1M6PKL6_9CLOT|nr:ABC transporter ATP-binding protein [Hathewaya proteolytica]SHK08427.1 peptide/nickel transport system ATP-binding protein [Hathewaya proteolytica DSM 3090]
MELQKTASKPESILRTEGLSVSYIVEKKRIKAVKNVDIQLYSGEALGIVGESGSGKSTMVMAIMGLLEQKKTEIQGSVFFHHEDLINISEESIRQFRWKNISMVFQKSMNALSPIHKIGRQLVDVYKVHGSGESQVYIKNRILDLFSMCNLPERVFQCYPYELSGGMMQRVGIAMSLIHYPEIVILDEATTALDVVTEHQIMKELKSIRRKLNVTPIFITHDLSIVNNNCEKVAVMYGGHLVEYGCTEDVISNPLHPYTLQLINAYPELGAQRGTLKGIPGAMPDFSKDHKGCIFAERCNCAEKVCFLEEPKYIQYKEERMVACHRCRG